jgi:hypothetical protein
MIVIVIDEANALCRRYLVQKSGQLLAYSSVQTQIPTGGSCSSSKETAFERQQTCHFLMIDDQKPVHCAKSRVSRAFLCSIDHRLSLARKELP